MGRQLTDLQHLGAAVALWQDEAIEALYPLDGGWQRLERASGPGLDVRALGQMVAAEQDRQLVPLSGPPAALRYRRGVWSRVGSAWSLLGAASAMALVAVVLLFQGDTERAAQLSFSVGPSRGTIGQAVQAGTDALPPTLRFTDGSTVALQRRARVRVRELDARGAVVSIERGRAMVYVKPRRRARWTLEAGPFTVHVVGTRFGLAWQPERKRLSLEMRHGKVEVEGPLLGRRRTVVAGEALLVWLDQARVEVRRPEPAPATASRAPAGVEAQADEPPGASMSPPIGDSPADRVAHAPSVSLAQRAGQVALRRFQARSPRVHKRLHHRRRRRQAATARRSALAVAREATPAPSARPTPRPIAPLAAAGDTPMSSSARAETHASPARVGQLTENPPAAGGGDGVALKAATEASRPLPQAPAAARASDQATHGRRRRAQQLGAVFVALEAGRLEDAFALAQQAEWDRVAGLASPNQLVALADAARFSRRTELARAIYLQVRARAKGSRAAARAAFALGQLAFIARDFIAAATWFVRYLDERPDGRLAEAAYGRRLEALARAGRVARSCAAARDYLARYAGGAHRRLAQRVLRACHD